MALRSLLLFGALLSSTLAIPLSEPRDSSKTLQPPPLPASALPPPTDLNLKVITLGVGTQNYTCNATTGTYGSNVALAQLYDATRYLSKHPDEVSSLPHRRLQQYIEAGDCAEESDYDPHLKHIGEHYFETANPGPDFDLYKLDLFLEAKTADRVPAPDTANDIDWVYLVDNGKGETKGLKAVYRVETAGGKPPTTCSGTEQIFIPYVAEYWFYD